MSSPVLVVTDNLVMESVESKGLISNVL